MEDFHNSEHAEVSLASTAARAFNLSDAFLERFAEAAVRMGTAGELQQELILASLTANGLARLAANKTLPNELAREMAFLAGKLVMHYDLEIEHTA